MYILFCENNTARSAFILSLLGRTFIIAVILRYNDQYSIL